MSRDTILMRGFSEKMAPMWATESTPGPLTEADVVSTLFDWDVIEADVDAAFTYNGDDFSIRVPDRKALVRSDTFETLGIHSKKYEVHPYREWLLRQVEMIADERLAIGGAGYFRHGARAFVQFEMPENREVNGVEYRSYLSAGTSHDGSMSTTYTLGNIVIICTNTFASAMSLDERYLVRHRKGSSFQAERAREAIGYVFEVAEEFEAMVRDLTAETVTGRKWDQFVFEYSGLDRQPEGRALTLARTRANDLRTLWNESSMVAPWAGTAYGVLAAVNTARHHLATVRASDRPTRNMERLVSGGNLAPDQAALRLLASL
jgi:phage/plasmid-like protein (TIGR03299 family)